MRGAGLFRCLDGLDDASKIESYGVKKGEGLKKKEAIVGLTFVEGIVFGVKGKKQLVRFLVDSGATYTLIPKTVWEDLGLKPKKALTFVLGDGTSITRQVSECKIRILGEEGHTPIILGEAEDEPLLGSVTLEILGLVLDPFKRELRPMQIRLA